MLQIIIIDNVTKNRFMSSVHHITHNLCNFYFSIYEITLVNLFNKRNAENLVTCVRSHFFFFLTTSIIFFLSAVVILKVPTRLQICFLYSYTQYSLLQYSMKESIEVLFCFSKKGQKDENVYARVRQLLWVIHWECVSW